MAQITRSTKIGGGTTLSANTTARAADVETDVLTLFNAYNNADTGTVKWQVVSAENAVSTVLIVNNSSGTNAIADFKDGGTSAVTISDGGHTDFLTGNVTVTAGTLAVSAGNITLGSGVIRAADGTAAAPSYTFGSSGNTDNGLYLAGSDNPAISVGGTKRLDISTTAITSALPLAMGSNKITGGAAATAATDFTIFSQLKYIQAPVIGTSATSTATTSSTYQNTGLAASITPTSASNRIKITVSGGMQVAAVATSEACITVKRGSTDLSSSAQGFSLIRGQAALTRAPASFVYIDSPATTSSTTYTVAVRSIDNTNSVAFVTGSAELGVIILEEVV